VQQAVFGFFSANENMNFDHSIFTGPQPNYFEGSKQEFYTFLVKNFTLPAATVLDMTNDQGTVSINIFDAVILFPL